MFEPVARNYIPPLAAAIGFALVLFYMWKNFTVVPPDQAHVISGGFKPKIFDGKGDGIDVLGMGFMKIYNNLIVRAGKTFEPGNPSAFKKLFE